MGGNAERETIYYLSPNGAKQDTSAAMPRRGALHGSASPLLNNTCAMPRLRFGPRFTGFTRTPKPPRLWSFRQLVAEFAWRPGGSQKPILHAIGVSGTIVARSVIFKRLLFPTLRDEET